MVLITSGATTVAPQLVTTIETAREGRTIVHTILGRSNPDVTLRPAALRTGRIEMGFQGATSEADSAAAEAVFAGGGVFIVAAPERPTLEMTAVPGRVSRALDDVTRDAWLVSVEFTEVSA